MQIIATSVSDYIDQIPEERQASFHKLRNVILENLPDGFKEGFGYGMVGYCVPHSIYPAGYHCDPKQALPFLAIASQKNFIAVYHMGIYCDPSLLDWFVSEFSKRSKLKLDMGKSCIRFKKHELIPFDLIGELVNKMSVDQWIDLYETNLKKTINS